MIEPLPVAAEVPVAPPTAPVRLAARPRRSRSVPALLSLAAAVAVAGLCFTIGRVSAPSQTTAAVQNASGALDDRGAGGGLVSSVTGTVVSISASSMTIQLADGQTVEVATGSSTTYHNQAASTSSSVAAGDTVAVQVSGGNDGPNTAASASSSASGGTRTATDVTVTGP